jgi:hypothetical protein
MTRFLDRGERLGIEDAERFEVGLGWLLDGIEASLPTRSRRRKRS